VWSITCLFVAKEFRGQGLSEHLLKAAVAYAGGQGARIVEGYPYSLDKGKRWPDSFVWTGLESSFRKAGFAVALRRSPSRPIMRVAVGRKTPSR
jgi:GNAT superfamily N-acetyltransferase